MNSFRFILVCLCVLIEFVSIMQTVSTQKQQQYQINPTPGTHIKASATYTFQIAPIVDNFITIHKLFSIHVRVRFAFVSIRLN